MTRPDEKRGSTARPSLNSAQEAIRVLFEPGQVVELRALGARYTTSGYYDNFELLAADSIRLAASPEYHGIYWTLQALNPALLARSPNIYKERVRDTTADQDISAFRWLLVDLDPQRPTGISASDSEKKLAFEVAEKIVKFFRTEANYDPMLADSGNGYHVLARISVPASDAPVVKRCLEALAARFDTDSVKVDRKVFNPARIGKAFGTVARKGANVSDRPHRVSGLINVGDPNATLDRAFIDKLAGEAKQEQKKSKKKNSKSVADPAAMLEKFLAEGGVAHGSRLEYMGGWKWQLDACPFNNEHRTPDAIVTVSESGASGFACSHNSCSDQHWAEFRKFVEEKIGHPFAFAETRAEVNSEAILTDPQHVEEMTKKSELVLHAIGLKYFERNGELVHTAYARDLPASKDIHRAEDSVLIQEASSDTIIRDLDRRAIYVKTVDRETGVETREVHVPEKLPGQIKSRVCSEVRSVPFPSLNLVSASPVFLPSGKVTDQGFEDGVLYVPPNRWIFPEVPDRPDKNAAKTAMRSFDEIFHKFPFVDPGESRVWNETASYSAVLAAVLSLVARPYIGLGAIPLVASNSSTPRSGKTKIVEAICAAALGHRPSTAHFVDEAELGKHLLPLMRSGDRAILLDNLERTLQSTKLCVLITNGVLRDRILGESRDVTLKNYSVLFASGNNIVLGGDLTVRSLRIDIDAALERPESRGFDFDPVNRAIERHPQLVTGALTALRAFSLAGLPWELERQKWGGFERWDSLVCGCLKWMGYADPYLTRERVIGADPAQQANVEILCEWNKQYGATPVSLHEVRNDKHTELFKLLAGKDGDWDGYHVQWLLRKLEGRIHDGYRLIRLTGRSRFNVVDTLSAEERKAREDSKSLESKPTGAESGSPDQARESLKSFESVPAVAQSGSTDQVQTGPMF